MAQKVYLPESDCDCYFQAVDLLNEILQPLTDRMTNLENQFPTYSGMSTDDKPSDAEKNAIFFEVDTGKFYYFDGDAWHEISCGECGGECCGTAIVGSAIVGESCVGGTASLPLQFFFEVDCEGKLLLNDIDFLTLYDLASRGVQLICHPKSSYNVFYSLSVSDDENGKVINFTDGASFAYDSIIDEYIFDYVLSVNAETFVQLNYDVSSATPPVLVGQEASFYYVESKYGCDELFNFIENCGVITGLKSTPSTVIDHDGVPQRVVGDVEYVYFDHLDEAEFYLYDEDLGDYDYLNPVTLPVISGPAYLLVCYGNRLYYYYNGIA